MERTELESRIKRVGKLVWIMTGATLMAGLTLAAMAITAEDAAMDGPLAEQDLIALMIGIIAAIVLISASMVLFSRILARDAGISRTPEERIRQYTSAYILRTALLEGGVLANVILFFVFHQDVSLLIAAGPYALMFLQHPSIDHFERIFPAHRRSTEA